MSVRFDSQVAAIMKDARQAAMDMGNNYIGSEHILLSLMKDTTTAFSKILATQGVFYFQMKEDLMVLFGLKDKEVQEIQVTQVVEDILERSMQMVEKHQRKRIDVDTLTLALLQSESCVALELLNRYDLDLRFLLNEFQDEQCELDSIPELRNLNVLYNNPDIVGREKEIDFMISVLSRKEKANPLLIGEAGVGKTALVEKLACMIRDQQVPPSLKNAYIYELHLNSLVAGTKYRGDFEEKLQNLIQALKKHQNVILFIDEIHQMIGAGKSEGSIDVSSVLKPYLARGDIRCIGATTFEEYEKFIAKDRALERRFQVIKVKEPGILETKAMLLVKLKEYELYHQVRIEDDIVMRLIQYCDYYMPNRKFPDKAIDVLDLACVKAKRQGKGNVDIMMVQSVIEQLIDIPIATHDRIAYLKASLLEHIVGQGEVIEQMIKQVTWIEQCILANRPLGVWLFLGDTRVGKHTAVKVFSKAYFNQEDAIELDMAMFDSAFPNVLLKIKRNPYSAIYISNLQDATSKHLQFLRCAIKRGYFEEGLLKVDLRHSVIIMSGKFHQASESTLRFCDKQDHMSFVKKALGEDFMEVFDEVLCFKNLIVKDKCRILKRILKDSSNQFEDKDIVKAIELTHSLEEAIQKLKQQIVHS